MDIISTDNAYKTVLFLRLIGLLVFCIYTLTFRPCVLFTVCFNKLSPGIKEYLNAISAMLMKYFLCLYWMFCDKILNINISMS